MATIIPGYDFGVNEAPTREAFLRQARLMKASGLEIDSIDATLIGLKSGNSGTTNASLPAQGWLWADPEGSLWVETSHGPCMLKRAGGGWESVRYGISFPTGNPAAWSPGWKVDADSISTPSAQQTDGLNLSNGESGAIRAHHLVFNAINSVVDSYMFVNATTLVSGDSFPRMVNRGMSFLKQQGTLSEQDKLIRRPGVYSFSTDPNFFKGSYANPESNQIEPSGADVEHWYAVGVAPDSGTSLALDGPKIEVKNYIRAWKWGPSIFGPGTTI